MNVAPFVRNALIFLTFYCLVLTFYVVGIFEGVAKQRHDINEIRTQLTNTQQALMVIQSSDHSTDLKHFFATHAADPSGNWHSIPPSKK